MIKTICMDAMLGLKDRILFCASELDFPIPSRQHNDVSYQIYDEVQIHYYFGANCMRETIIQLPAVTW